MEDKIVWHIPIFSALIIQLFSSFVLILLLVEFSLGLSGQPRNICIIAFSTLVFLDFLTLLFSLLFWWNRPLIFSIKGIEKNTSRQSRLISWKEIDNIKVMVNWAGRYYRVRIFTKSGLALSFEPNSTINKDILKLCPVDTVKAMYRNALKIKG